MNYDAATISSYWDILFRQSDFHCTFVFVFVVEHKQQVIHIQTSVNIQYSTAIHGSVSFTSRLSPDFHVMSNHICFKMYVHRQFRVRIYHKKEIYIEYIAILGMLQNSQIQFYVIFAFTNQKLVPFNRLSLSFFSLELCPF